MKMKLPFLIFPIIAAITLSSYAQQEELPVVRTSAAFKQLQRIVGKWKGELTREDGTIVDLESEFSVTSNGSAIVERSIEGGTEMFTIYHDKNGQLTVTHYCALGNAPSFTLSKKDIHTLSFAFDSSCGLKAGKDKFVNHWEIKFDPKQPNKLQSYYKTIEKDQSVVSSSARLTRVK
jgi:WD40 repeat protein